MMPYPSPAERQEAWAWAKGCLVVLVVLLVACLLPFSCSATQTQEIATYDYAGPDGTLMGVPYELDNYVVEDHDTGCYYFLIINEETHDMALCPRYEADGTLWQHPLREEASDV